MKDRPFVLLCAGEDSGDVLGEGFVVAIRNSGFDVRGVGGARMSHAGLKPVIDFEDLPVSGFGDVLPRYFRLRKLFKVLKAVLSSPECVAFVAIDYPGFNMALTAFAKKLKKPVLYVAPPQVWAWKRSRAQKLRGVSLAVLFEFERSVYEKFGCHARLLRHPFMESFEKTEPLSNSGLAQSTVKSETLLLLPGSRKKQAVRNMRFFADVASRYVSERPSCDILVMASRNAMKSHLETSVEDFFPENLRERVSVRLSPEKACSRSEFLSSAALALCAPGTSSLELVLSGVPHVVCGIFDPLTYFMGRHFVDTRFFALPNILLSREAFPEVLMTMRKSRSLRAVDSVLDLLKKVEKESSEDFADNCIGNACAERAELRAIMSAGESPESLVSEFLGQFVQRNAN